MKERAVSGFRSRGLRCAVYVFNEKEDVSEPAAGGPDDMVRELMNTRIALIIRSQAGLMRLNERFFDSARL